jgi:Holliday junction resolvase
MNSREKGKRGEREAAKAMAEHLGCVAKRGVQYQGGVDSPDVVHNIPGMHVEVKRTEKVQLQAWMEQAIRDAGDQIPTVLHRKNNTEWLLTVRLSDAARLAEIINSQAAEVGQ